MSSSSKCSGSARRVSLISGIAAVLFSTLSLADYGLNFQKPVTAIAKDVYQLHMLILWICVVIGIVVFGVMFYSIFAHRKSRGHKAAKFHESTTVEVVWTAIPFLILVTMAVPSTATLLKIYDESKADVVIKVTGFQWKWKYEYPDQDVSFFSALSTPRDQIDNKAAKDKDYLLEVDNPMVIPVGKRVRFVLTGNDVIHSWWVPALGIKQDAIPGFVRDTWFRAEQPGVYRGQCAELCGKEHGFMPIVVQAVEPEKYAAWVAEQKKVAAAHAEEPGKAWTLEELKARGEKVYAANCVACHQQNGMGVPGTFPALSGSKVVNGPKEEQIRTELMGVMRDGKPTAMVGFANQLSDTDLAAVITYTRNSWANKTGEMILPDEVKAQRK